MRMGYGIHKAEAQAGGGDSNLCDQFYCIIPQCGNAPMRPFRVLNRNALAVRLLLANLVMLPVVLVRAMLCARQGRP